MLTNSLMTRQFLDLMREQYGGVEAIIPVPESRRANLSTFPRFQYLSNEAAAAPATELAGFHELLFIVFHSLAMSSEVDRLVRRAIF